MIKRLLESLCQWKRRRKYAGIDTTLAISLPLQVIMVDPDDGTIYRIGRPFGHSASERQRLGHCLASWMKEDTDGMFLTVIIDTQRQGVSS